MSKCCFLAKSPQCPVSLYLSPVTELPYGLAIPLLNICLKKMKTLIQKDIFMSVYKSELLGVFWKCTRLDEGKNPYAAVCCFVMVFCILFH
uniref:Uncharacterized protein n=1 Tax=Sus scrofa TaxID=9823 RepID=A0A8D0ZLK9_PIG